MRKLIPLPHEAMGRNGEETWKSHPIAVIDPDAIVAISVEQYGPAYTAVTIQGGEKFIVPGTVRETELHIRTQERRLESPMLRERLGDAWENL